jgi:orotidine-5'-phosphate decarboxylase
MHRHPVQTSTAAKEKIIVPLDVSSEAEARRLIEILAGHVGLFKIGDQLFTRVGPSIVREIKEAGSKVFLDLKFHDIPNTVQHAVESACALGVDMLTIHLSGGKVMCNAAVAGRGSSPTLILGVTVLTSLDDQALAEAGFRMPVREQVLLLATLAQQSGITGLVASPQELEVLRKKFGSFFTTVIPGIRPSWAATGDQRRILSPKEAVKAGADYLVIGRPITGSPDPVGAVARIVEEMR